MKKLLKKLSKLHIFIKLCIAFVLFVVIQHLLQGLITETFGNPTSCTYYHMETCSHCKNFNPIWDDFASTYNGNIALNKIEANDAGDDLQKYNIDGFPTVLLIDEAGQTKTFYGPRTNEGLTEFLST